MSITDSALSTYFSPEDRKRGEDLFAKDAVMISSASDTAVRAFVKASASPKVSLLAEDVASSAFSADCSCPSANKGNLCKHVWAVLLKLEQRDSDFLHGKAEIHKSSRQVSPGQSEAKQRQADYRKQQYEKQKVRAKQQRRDKRAVQSSESIDYPETVAEARSYFIKNGFPLQTLDMEQLLNAKRLLSRVFHPDKGGTHEETVELNQYFEVIRDYLNG